MDRDSVLMILVTMILFGVGIVMIFSASMIYAQHRFHDPYFFIKRQLAFGGVGLLVLVLASRIRYTVFLRASKIILGVSIVMVLATYVPSLGKSAGGARRWLSIGGFSFQPSELLKIGMITYLAQLLSRNRRKVRDFVGGLCPLLFIVGVAGAAVFFQPDFGTAFAIVLVSTLLLFCGGVRILHIGALSIFSLPVLYHFIMSVPYRRRRILAFLDPWKDPQGFGFQIIQSLIAIGSGGIFGVGLGYSRQKLHYLPEAHTDFIFSIIGEELGCVGTVSILLLYVALIVLIGRIALKTQQYAGHLIVVGVLCMMAIETATNIGVVTALLPTKGMPLPFISFGGTSLITKMFAIGMVVSVSRYAPTGGVTGNADVKAKSRMFRG